MKKWIALVLVFAILAVFLSACGSAENAGIPTKYIVIVCVVLALLALPSCFKKTAATAETKRYDISSDIRALDIRINAADFIIQQGDSFCVESNLKYLSVSEKDGVLTIEEKTKNATDYTDAVLKLWVPGEKVLEDVAIATGAAKLTADPLSANSMNLKLGAGNVQFAHLNVSSRIHIAGGAGEISVMDGTLNNLTLRMGAGELHMTAALLGDNALKFGVGNANVTLIGNREDYVVSVGKGIGSINIDGITVVSSFSGKNVPSRVKIEGGIGAANVSIRER